MNSVWSFTNPRSPFKPDNTYRNIPQEDANRLKQYLEKVRPPHFRAEIQGDDARFKEEMQRYSVLQFSMQKQISELENLAFAVEMAIRPEKRRKAVLAYQKLTRNSPEMKALKEKLKKVNN